MKVILSALARSKLAAASPSERRVVNGALQTLGAAASPSGSPIKGMDNAFVLSTTNGGPLVLYEFRGDVATVKGVITSTQQHLGKHKFVQTPVKRNRRSSLYGRIVKGMPKSPVAKQDKLSQVADAYHMG